MTATAKPTCEYCGRRATRLFAQLWKPELLGSAKPDDAFLTIPLCEKCWNKEMRQESRRAER